ncbi:MAG: hypothetical protein R3E88_15540 [Myxococcota bacterium]
MFHRLTLLAIAALVFGPSSAFAASSSCALFAVFKSYDAAKHEVEVDFVKGNERKFFPRPDSGGGNQQSKLPKQCSGKFKKEKIFSVKETGGRLSVTQVRSNFEGRMLNDLEDPNWLPGQLQKLIAEKTEVPVVIRPGMGKNDPLSITTLYLPITDDELKEIERIEAQVEDVD